MGKRLINVYHVDINPDFLKTFKTPLKSSFGSLLSLLIHNEGIKRKIKRIKEAENTPMYLKGVNDFREILEKLEGTFGALRLLIISRENGEVITTHNINPAQ